ncbi:MAG: CcmD family protein [Nitrospinales bacterium]
MDDQLGFLFAANAFVWAGIFLYIFRLMRQNQALKRDLDLLKDTLNKNIEK